jgi:hypothetical protein
MSGRAPAETDGTPMPAVAPIPPGSRRPLLATGLAAAAIGAMDGGMSLLWETRGAPLEWGGVYAAGVRLTGAWNLRLVTTRGVVPLPVADPPVDPSGGMWEVVHRSPPLTIRELVAVSPGGPAVGRELTIETDGGSPERVLVESGFSPSLAPVLVEGVKPYEYEVRTRGTTVEVTSHGYGLGFDARPLASHLWLNRDPWIGGRWSGELSSLTSDHELLVDPGAPATLRLVLWGGVERTLRQTPPLGVGFLQENWRESAQRAWSEWAVNLPKFRFPQAPELEDGCALAIRALRRLYTAPDPTMVGLVAGYPWYSAIWCRDLAWMLPTVIWLGDYDWAARSLRTAFRYQARRRVAVLGAEEGEIPMQVSPGPIFLFGTSDTTLHYPGLVRRYACHSGRDDLAHELREGVAAAIRWGRAKTDPRTGLLRHGGEVAEIDGATARIGSVHYGFDAPDTTIWDSTDRRDHAIDVQALWIDALESAAELTGPEAAAEAASLRAEAASVRGRIGAYRWPEEEYLFDSLRVDGTPVRRLRPNALRAVSAGLLPIEVAVAAVRRAAREDLTAPWGVRTLSDRDPGYDPQAYHDGQVWPIATAWAADAALAVGDTELGYRYLRLLADRLRAESGLANECYRGDRDAPFDSCFLLGFSVAPFLTVVFERLWGLRVRNGAGSVAVDPRFPPGWEHASLNGLRVGDGYLDLDWHPSGLTLSWRGPSPLEVLGPAGRVVLRPGTTSDLPMSPPGPKSS